MLKKLAAVAALLLAGPVGAQQVQPWPDVSVTVPLADRWVGSGEVIGRFADDSRASQFESRLQIGHPIGKRVTVWAGWVHFANYLPNGRTTFEDQAVEQINWAIGSVGKLRVLTRTRLEQRFLSNVQDTSWRYRQQLRVMLPLASARGPSAVAWTEPFVAMNRNAAQHHTLDQLRTFAGVSVPLSKRADVEVGYLNQRIYRQSDKLVNHAIPLIINYRF